MRARKQVYLRVQRTQLVDLATVRTHLILDDQTAHLIRLDRVADLLDLLEHRVLLFFAFIFPRFKQRDGFFAQLVDLRITLQLLFDGDRFADHGLKAIPHLTVDLFIYREQLDLALFLADSGDDLFLERAQFLDVFMSEHQRTEHIFLAHFLRAGLHHVDGFARASEVQADIALLTLLHRRIDDVFSIDAADLHAGDRSVEGNVGNAQGQG